MKELNARFLLLGAALACAPCLLADANAAMAESWVGTLPAARFASGAEVPPLDVTGPRSVHVAGDFARFEHVWTRLDRGEPARIAVIGGSITQGAGASKPDRRWGETFCAGWRRAFPNAKIDFVNAGIGATGSDIGAFRLQRDVLDKKPDVVVVEFDVNDPNTRERAESYEGVVRQLLKAPGDIAVILLGMVGQTGNNSQEWHAKVARHYNLPHVSWRDALFYPYVKEGTVKWSDLSPDTVHPNDIGHAYAAALLNRYLSRKYLEWKTSGRAPAAISPLPAPLFGTRYDKGEFRLMTNVKTIESKGFFPLRDHCWGDGLACTNAGSRIVFEVEGSTVAILYRLGCKPFNWGKMDVYIDGEPVVRNHSCFRDQWWWYTPALFLCRDKPGRHVVEVVALNEKDDKSNGYGCHLAGLLVTDTMPAADVTMRPDGEVRTIAAALEKVRALRASGAIPPDRVAEVSVEPGRYPVKEAATFTPADSNVRFVAAKEGQSVFDGGVELPQFTAGSDGIWRARVPEGLTFEQLYVNGRRAQRARTPNEFYFYMRGEYDGDENPLTGKPEDVSRKAMMASVEDMAPLAALPPDELARVEVLLWQSWDMGRSRIAHVDAKTGLVMLSEGTSRPLFFWSSTYPRYALENYRGALDAPGEWFHDVKAGELLYIPLAGERVESTRAVAPVAPRFVVFAGDPLAGSLVRNVTFEGLAFEHAAWTLPGGGVRNAQSAQNVRDAAILGDGVHGFSMERCRLSHVGMHGVWLKRGCRKCRIVRCLIEDLGGGGVYLGDTAPWKQDGEARVTAFNRVSNSIIRSGGFTLNGAIGVWIGHASDNEIVHNDIGDFRYTGVSMGWTWGYAPTVAKRNRLMWNRIHHIGWGVLSDMGGVYTLGNSEGTVEIGNWIHDVNGYSGAGSPAWGLYTDEGSAGILLASNLVERCRDGAVHQHYGKDNTFANNIFATFERSGVWRSRVEDHTTIIVTNNVFWWTNSASHIVRGGVKGGKVTDLVMDGNLYWCTGGISSNAFFGKPLETWRADGHDCASRVGDPLFRDPLHGDWRLEPESPALKMGFVPWDWTAAGVLKHDAAWRAEAMDDTRYPPLKDAPPAPRCHRTSGSISFEKYKAGKAAKKNIGIFSVHGERGVAVTDKTAASGTKSLRLADGPDLGAPWQPHLIAKIGAEQGSVRIRWSFRTDDKAHPQFECRDYRQDGARPYAIGPSITFAAGHVRAGGRKIADVPVGEWSRVEILLHVTGPKAGTWSCTVTPPGGEPVTVDGLKVQAGFRVLEWNGFMTNGKEGTWYLDDFSVEPVK